jgi:hypothetical protein
VAGAWLPVQATVSVLTALGLVDPLSGLCRLLAVTVEVCKEALDTPQNETTHSKPGDNMAKPKNAKDIDRYISQFSADVQAILQKVRTTTRHAARE